VIARRAGFAPHSALIDPELASF
jgi:hypothetical protein